MKINDFKASDIKQQNALEKRLDSFKLERVLSLWYFIRSATKGFIVGSKR